MELAMENRELMWKELIEELPSKVDEACTAIMQILMADGYLHLKWPMPMEHFERIAGLASRQGRDQRLRPAGRGLQQPDPAALGGGGGQAIRRDVACRHNFSESFEPVLALADAVHLQVGYDTDDAAAGQDHDLVRRLQ